MTAATRRALITAALLAPALLFLALAFVLPLAFFFKLSLSSPKGMFAAYAEILGSWLYTRVFWNTLVLAASVTAITVLLGYPTAYMLARLKGLWLTLAVYGVLFPLWISVLIRTFAWILLLEKNGPINRLLVESGILSAPAAFLFNDTGVMIGMVHVLLPYAILPIYASLLRIDPRLLLASDGLGASPVMTFLRVYLPLSLPGVGAAAALVFLLSLGFFITPALLGGIGNLTLSMLIETLVDERLIWPLAAAAAFILLGGTLALLLIGARLLPMRQMMVAR